MVTTDDRPYPCETVRNITVSLDGIKPATVSLSMPVVLGSIKEVLHRRDDIVEIFAVKAIKEIWLEDIVDERFRWNADKLEPWKDLSLVPLHANVQFRWIPTLGFARGPGREGDTLTKIRQIIRRILTDVSKKGIVRFKLLIRQSTGSKVRWFVRAHLPVATSPVGTPLVILSAMDCHEDEGLHSMNKKSQRKTAEELERIFSDLPSRDIILDTPEELRLISFILLVNSTKIQPTSWQKKNLPSTAWLATFLRPLYPEFNFTDNDFECSNCRKDTSANPRRCANCKSPYRTVECQRDDWSKHQVDCKP